MHREPGGISLRHLIGCTVAISVGTAALHLRTTHPKASPYRRPTQHGPLALHVKRSLKKSASAACTFAETFLFECSIGKANDARTFANS
jgi:hypothetical protein